MSTSSTRLDTPEGPGSVTGSPGLPDGFSDTFSSRYVDIGELRLTRSSAARVLRCCSFMAGLRPGTRGAW